jgi:hypothetical protein
MSCFRDGSILRMRGDPASRGEMAASLICEPLFRIRIFAGMIRVTLTAKFGRAPGIPRDVTAPFVNPTFIYYQPEK